MDFVTHHTEIVSILEEAFQDIFFNLANPLSAGVLANKALSLTPLAKLSTWR